MAELLYFIISLPVFITFSMFSMIRCKLGYGFIYTGIKRIERKGNKEVTLWKFLKDFSEQHKAIFLDTDQGKTVVVHGLYDGKFFVDHQEMTTDQFVAYTGICGKWNLVSCCNRLHDASSQINDVQFVREEVINTKHCTFILPVRSELYCYSSKWVDRYSFILTWIGAALGIIKEED